jgi:hypothetical protein
LDQKTSEVYGIAKATLRPVARAWSSDDPPPPPIHRFHFSRFSPFPFYFVRASFAPFATLVTFFFFPGQQFGGASAILLRTFLSFGKPPEAPEPARGA